jgi:hypothetical protein
MVTPLGAFGIRCTTSDVVNGTLTVESRIRSDLEALIAAVLPSACPIVEVIARTRGYMTRCGRGEVALGLATLALDLDYDNIEQEFTDQQGSDRSAVSQSLWQAITGP